MIIFHICNKFRKKNNIVVWYLQRCTCTMYSYLLDAVHSNQFDLPKKGNPHWDNLSEKKSE